MPQIRTIKKARDTGRLDRARVRSVAAAMRDGTPLGDYNVTFHPAFASHCTTIRTPGPPRDSGRGLNKTGLIQQLASRASMSRADAARTLDALFSVKNGIIAEALHNGDKVQITGFGSFEVKRREARKGRNPRTGKEVDITPSATASFRVGKGLKDALSGEGSR